MSEEVKGAEVATDKEPQGDKYTGIISRVVSLPDTLSAKWKKFAIQFEDGTQVNMVVFPKDRDYEPKTGDELTIVKSMYGNWSGDMSDKPIFSDDTPTKNGTAKDAVNSANLRIVTGAKDQEIRFQAIFRDVTKCYAPILEKCETEEDVDKVIDRCYSKAQQICDWRVERYRSDDTAAE